MILALVFEFIWGILLYFMIVRIRRRECNMYRHVPGIERSHSRLSEAFSGRHLYFLEPLAYTLACYHEPDKA